ncbi:hypothetical protein TPA0908_10010 [Micromonospora sp. AKA38]|nr:hypothetical protein TPA0908_10010 [Micromonospora sp. AKA38]
MEGAHVGAERTPCRAGPRCAGDGNGRAEEGERRAFGSTERARVPDQVDVHASGEEKLVPLRHALMLPTVVPAGQRPSSQ